MNQAPPITAGRFSAVLSWPFLCAIVVVAVSLRIAWIVAIDHSPVNDGAWYFETAVGLVEGLGYVFWGRETELPTAQWPVGYPAYLSLLFSLTGPSMVTVKISNLVLDLGALWFLYTIVRKEFESELAARLSVLMLVAMPSAIAFLSLNYSEPCLLFFLLASIACWIRSRQEGGWIYVVSAGVLFGIAVHVKPVVLFVPACLTLVDLYHERRGTWTRSFAVHLSMVLILVPWTIRNYQQFGYPMVVSSNSGVNLMIGNNPAATGGFIRLNYLRKMGFDYKNHPLVLAAIEEGNFSNSADQNRIYRDVALDYARNNPRETLARIPSKLVHLYGDDMHSIRINLREVSTPGAKFLEGLLPFAEWYYAVFGVLGLAAAFALACFRKLEFLFSYPTVIVGYFTAVYLVFFGSSRFHYPIIPFVAIWIGLAIADWHSRTRPSESIAGHAEDPSD